MDKKLLSLFVLGDKKAFEQVYRSYSEQVFKRILYVLKNEDDAEELLQNVFVKFWTNRAIVDVNRNVANYLMRIADSMAIDLLRRNIHSQVVYDQLSRREDNLTDSVEDSFVHKEEWKILEKAVNLLPPQRKLIFTLCKIEGRTYAEVSQMLQISPATISNHLVLAMKQIRLFTSQYDKEFKMFFLLSFFENI